MSNKFNLKKNKITTQFTDGSVSFFEIIVHTTTYKFDKDIRSTQKWEFHFFDYKQQNSFFPENIIKFRRKFMKIF